MVFRLSSRKNVEQPIPQLVLEKKREERRDFIKRLVRFSAAAMLYGGYEATRTKGTGRPEERIAYSKDELIHLLKEELGDSLVFCEKMDPLLEENSTASVETELNTDNTPYEAYVMTSATLSEVSKIWGNLVSDPKETISNASETITIAGDFTVNYQLSKTTMHDDDTSRKKDCNDYAYGVCEMLTENDIPAYFLSIWQKDPAERIPPSYHQMAACKLGTDTYLIIDNAKLVTIWHGSLERFAEQCVLGKEKEPAELMPRGIAPYLVPKWNNGPAKFMVHAWNAVSEEEMEPVLIKDKESLRIANVQ